MPKTIQHKKMYKSTSQVNFYVKPTEKKFNTA